MWPDYDKNVRLSNLKLGSWISTSKLTEKSLFVLLLVKNIVIVYKKGQRNAEQMCTIGSISNPQQQQKKSRHTELLTMLCCWGSRFTQPFAGWLSKINNSRSSSWRGRGCVGFVVARTPTVVFLRIWLLMVSTVLIQLALALHRASLCCYFCCYVKVKIYKKDV